MLNKSLDFLIINFLSYNSRWGGSLFLCVGNCLANCGRMVRYSAMVTMESLHEITTIALLPSLTSYDLPFPKGGPKCTAHDQLRDACCHLANMIEDIDKISSAYISSDVAPCLRNLMLKKFVNRFTFAKLTMKLQMYFSDSQCIEIEM